MDDDSDVGAVDAPEYVVRGVNIPSDSCVPSTECDSVLPTVREMLPLRLLLLHEPDDPRSEKPARDGAYCDRKSRSLRAMPNPKRDPGLLAAALPSSRSPSSSPAAANAFVVLGPSQSAGRLEGSYADSVRLELRARMCVRGRSPPVSRLGRTPVRRRLVAGPAADGARDDMNSGTS